jgi:nitrogen-specific signal transduction histidine kinase
VATRGSRIVRELMIYAGTEGEELVPLDISQVVDEIYLLKISVSKHAFIETELARGFPAVQANSARISQLVMNLVTNASEAIGDRHGIIRVVTRRVTDVQDGGSIAHGSASNWRSPIRVAACHRNCRPRCSNRFSARSPRGAASG